MNLGNLIEKFNFNLILIVFIFVLDRLSKLIVINLDKKNFSEEIFSSQFLDIQLTWNDGIAFGLLSFERENLYNVLTLTSVVVILIIFIILIRSKGFKKFSYSMILGGAIGNVFDRLLYRSVPDFIDFHVENFHWFIFNVADIFITMGVIFLILIEFTDNTEEKKL